MQLITSESEFDQAMEQSSQTPVVVFKHSTQCPISAAAYRQMESFAETASTPVYLVRVIEERPLSNSIAERLLVRHQSPQVMVVKSGGVTWQASHYDITTKAVTEAVNV